MPESIEERAKFDLVRYANCWEDADILCEALLPRPGKKILSIASAGDNTLALVAEGAQVVAADLSSAQLACLELRVAAIKQLEYPQLLQFLGIKSAENRLQTFDKLSTDLSDQCHSYWRQNSGSINRGIIHCGKFESYFHLFREKIIPLIHPVKNIDALLSRKSTPQRRDFYKRTWNNLRWRLLFKVFFSKFVMGRMGRDPEFFRYVEGSVADKILNRTRHALTELETHTNPYLEYILRGNFVHSLPLYLRPGKWQNLRENINNISWYQGPVQEVALQEKDGFDGFNLSDLFEYLSEDICSDVYMKLLSKAKPGARFAYWNMLVPRDRPDSAADRVKQLTFLADELFLKDKAFFYSRFIVDEVIR